MISMYMATARAAAAVGVHRDSCWITLIRLCPPCSRATSFSYDTMSALQVASVSAISASALTRRSSRRSVGTA
ncbi:hypothetical protein D3C85_741870 [compost metagenome]